MSATEEFPAEERRSSPSNRDALEDEPVAKDGWLKRLKTSLGSRLASILTAAIARLQSLKGRLGGDVDEDDPHLRARLVHQAAKIDTHTPVAVAAKPLEKRSHRLRAFILLTLLVLCSVALGAGVAYTFFIRLLKDQSVAMEAHEQDIRGFQLEEQEKEKRLAEMLHKLETEQKLRADMEARLVDVEQQRLAVEAKLKKGVAEPIKIETRQIDQTPTAEAQIVAKPVTNRPSKASTFRPPSTSNCNLAGSDPATLKRCIEEYNRK